MSPAFKEWQAIVNALLAGRQTIILRKGGIAEGRGGFRVGAPKFWLFPTRFHAQREKLQPAAAPFFEDVAQLPTDPNAPVVLSGYAELVEAAFLTEWSRAAALRPFHLWTDPTVRERFDWAQPPGLHLLLVRVHRLESPVTLALTPAMAGCKSWIELPLDFADHAARPVLGEEAFATQAAAVRAALQTSAPTGEA